MGSPTFLCLMHIRNRKSFILRPKIFLHLLCKIPHDDRYFRHLFRQRAKRIVKKRLSAYFHKRFRSVIGKRTHPHPLSSRQNYRFQFSIFSRQHTVILYLSLYIQNSRFSTFPTSIFISCLRYFSCTSPNALSQPPSP